MGFESSGERGFNRTSPGGFRVRGSGLDVARSDTDEHHILPRRDRDDL
jgi:hypothetical protein